jgi:alanine dehydrogenase
MIIGVPKEIKNNENRVSLVPSGARALVENGHRVIVERSAGKGSSIADQEYLLVGAEIKESPQAIFEEAEMILKVKEPLTQEYDCFHEGQILFTYLHLAPAKELTQALLKKGIIGIAYETVQLTDGTLPLLEPMSEIAGKLSVQVGAHYLERENGGRGILLGGVPGIRPGNVLIIGGGTVGTSAARVALGMGACVTIVDISINRLKYLANILEGHLITMISNKSTLETLIADADLVVGATLRPGARADKLVTREMLATMHEGSVLVDVAIDQGGCFETSQPTTHDSPVYTVDGVLHYCVTNMPAAVSRSSTFALTNATFPYVLRLAEMGYKDALNTDIALKKGLNIYQGKIVLEPVAKSLGLECKPISYL